MTLTKTSTGLRWTLRAGAAAAAVATLVTGTITGIQPAHAATGWYRCPQGDICLYTGFHGTGRMARFHGKDGNLANGLGPQGMNDRAKSVFNRTGTGWCLYQNKDYQGWAVAVGSPVAKNLPQSTRDRVSSLRPMPNLYGC